MYRIFVLLICFVSIQVLTGQGLWETGAVKGIWVPPEKTIPGKDWKAQWIWLSAESPMMLSRKSFELGDQPQKAILKITATSQYKLYVNSQYIIKGLTCRNGHRIIGEVNSALTFYFEIDGTATNKAMRICC